MKLKNWTRAVADSRVDAQRQNAQGGPAKFDRRSDRVSSCRLSTVAHPGIGTAGSAKQMPHCQFLDFDWSRLTGGVPRNKRRQCTVYRIDLEGRGKTTKVGCSPDFASLRQVKGVV